MPVSPQNYSRGQDPGRGCVSRQGSWVSPRKANLCSEKLKSGARCNWKGNENIDFPNGLPFWCAALGLAGTLNKIYVSLNWNRAAERVSRSYTNSLSAVDLLLTKALHSLWVTGFANTFFGALHLSPLEDLVPGQGNSLSFFLSGHSTLFMPSLELKGTLFDKRRRAEKNLHLSPFPHFTWLCGCHGPIRILIL